MATAVDLRRDEARRLREEAALRRSSSSPTASPSRRRHSSTDSSTDGAASESTAPAAQPDLRQLRKVMYGKFTDGIAATATESRASTRSCSPMSERSGGTPASTASTTTGAPAEPFTASTADSKGQSPSGPKLGRAMTFGRSPAPRSGVALPAKTQPLLPQESSRASTHGPAPPGNDDAAVARTPDLHTMKQQPRLVRCVTIDCAPRAHSSCENARVMNNSKNSTAPFDVETVSQSASSAHHPEPPESPLPQESGMPSHPSSDMARKQDTIARIFHLRAQLRGAAVAPRSYSPQQARPTSVASTPEKPRVANPSTPTKPTTQASSFTARRYHMGQNLKAESTSDSFSVASPTTSTCAPSSGRGGAAELNISVPLNESLGRVEPAKPPAPAPSPAPSTPAPAEWKSPPGKYSPCPSPVKPQTSPAVGPPGPAPSPNKATPPGTPESPKFPAQKVSRVNSNEAISKTRSRGLPAFARSDSAKERVCAPSTPTRPAARPAPHQSPPTATSASKQPLKAYSPWEAGDDVHALRAACKKMTKEDFLEFVYAHHPPKNPAHKLNSRLDVKKQMQKALSHYHPDKQSLAEHGPEWCLICEEVCKEITRMYKKRPGPP